jgi:hypothetical protein
MLHVHPTHLVPNPQHRRQLAHRCPLGSVCIRTNGTRSLRSPAPLQHRMVHQEELFLCGRTISRILPTSQRSIRRFCLHAVRFPLSPNPKILPELTQPPHRVTFLLNLLLGIWSLIPTAAQRAANKYGLDDMQSKHSPTSDHSDREWEMKRVKVQATPAQPYTPRTLAFNTLDRQLPLRAAADKGRWS